MNKLTFSTVSWYVVLEDVDWAGRSGLGCFLRTIRKSLSLNPSSLGNESELTEQCPFRFAGTFRRGQSPTCCLMLVTGSVGCSKTPTRSGPILNREPSKLSPLPSKSLFASCYATLGRGNFLWRRRRVGFQGFTI